MSQLFAFEQIHQETNSRARLGRLHTPHGTIQTPVFSQSARVRPSTILG